VGGAASTVSGQARRNPKTAGAVAGGIVLVSAGIVLIVRRAPA
jgi:hypothetical protein